MVIYEKHLVCVHFITCPNKGKKNISILFPKRKWKSAVFISVHKYKDVITYEFNPITYEWDMLKTEHYYCE